MGAGAGTSTPKTQQLLTGFPVMDLARQVALYGSGQMEQPPDTQLAAGPTSIAEANNSVLSVWSKSGSLVMSADLNVFFAIPAGYHLGDPRILYEQRAPGGSCRTRVSPTVQQPNLHRGLRDLRSDRYVEAPLCLRVHRRPW